MPENKTRRGDRKRTSPAPGAEKPAFRREEDLPSPASFSDTYRLFREAGLGRVDAWFNALYTGASERSVSRIERRLRDEGESLTPAQRNEIHPFSLRLLSALPRFFRFFRDAWVRLGRHLFHRDPGGRNYRNSYRFFRRHIPHALLLILTAVCAFFVARTLTVPVVLEAEINGQAIGAVTGNAVVDSALRELEGNVSSILGRNFQFPFEIRYTFVRDDSAKIKGKNEISEILYSYLPDYICTGAGLYVDDTLVAVCASEDEIREEIGAITVDRMGIDGDVGVYNDVRVVNQAYPADSIISREDLRSLLNEMTVPPEEREDAGTKDAAAGETAPVPEPGAAAENGNGLLCDMEIPTIRLPRHTSNQPQSIAGIHLTFYRAEILRYQENVPFVTEYTESTGLYTSMADVTTQGKVGKNNVEARVYYVDGKEARREILSETVVSAPVNQVVTMGTRVLPEELGVTGVAGRFIMPRCAPVSSPFGMRASGMHRGLDIPGPTGANIYASASGTVITAIGQDGGFTYRSGSMYTGYGYCVVIQHEDGYATLYAHCSRICVTLGQEVKQGEKIAEVGETGEAYGSHVHFELQLNDVRLNPAEGYLYEGGTTIYDLKQNPVRTETEKTEPEKPGETY